MSEQEVLEVQHGIWINERWIRDAQLGTRLQIVVRPGEIRIVSMPGAQGTEEEEELISEDPVLAVAGILSGEPLSAEEIERELYGEGTTSQ
ncbi:MAG: hypothetical protein ACP5HM_16385 [Anaerolineae bacterium]